MATELADKHKVTGAAHWSRERLLAFVLFCATVCAFVICYFIARPFFGTLAWALALALITQPLYEWLTRRLHRKNWAAAVTVVIVAVALVAPAIFVTQRIVRNALAGIEALKAEAESGQWRAAIEHNPRLAPALHWLEAQFNLRNAAEQLLTAITAGSSTLLKNSVWVLTELFITFFFLFYFFRDRALVLGALRSLVPLSNAETDEIFQRVADTIHATVYGTLTVAVVQGVLGGLMFWWLGLPAPLLWGMAMALLAIVPVLGAFVVWVPAAVFLALEGQWGKALILGAWGLLAVSLIDNLLYPALVGKRLRLHTVPVFIAIVGGLMLFGAAGVILGPVALAVTVALVEVWRRRTAVGWADVLVRSETSK
jgi:predicted PurR-regulated permease PerM